MSFAKIYLLLTLNIIIFPLSINFVHSQSVADRRSAQRPAPPKRIPPNKVKPGGGLDFSRSACTQQQESLIALVPVDNPVLTTRSNPSFLFYIPDPASAIARGEFSLFTADEKTRLYSTEVTLTQTPGVIKIDLPESAEDVLEAGVSYHWYFKIYCQESSPKPYVDVDGWIERVNLTPVRERQIQAASPKIWYDAIANVANNLIATPGDAAARDRWLKLLQYIDREHLVNVNFSSTTAPLSEPN